MTGGISRPHTCSISQKRWTPSSESPPKSKKLSCTPMGARCRTRSQIGISWSIATELELVFTSHLIEPNQTHRAAHARQNQEPQVYCRSRMRERPVEFSCLRVQRTE